MEAIYECNGLALGKTVTVKKTGLPGVGIVVAIYTPRIYSSVIMIFGHL